MGKAYYLAVVVSRHLTLGWARATDRDRALVDAMTEAEISDICKFDYAFKVYKSTDAKVHIEGSILSFSVKTREGYVTKKTEDVDYRVKKQA